MCMRTLCAVFLVSGVLPAASYWPRENWRTASPESQGIDSQALGAALDLVREKGWGVHSLLVIRHGYAVLDASFYPFRPGTVHDLASVTKTITSTLTGIAAGQKLIDPSRKVLSFFPNEQPEDPDERKRQITVKHLVRMESGLDCGYAPGEQELEQMKRSPDWVRFALGLPMKYAPGTHTAYCSPGYHLLGSIIGAAARQPEAEFARKNLFEPLGIRDVIWPSDPQGRTHGWGDSHLYPQDLAKIGYLYLHGGEWDGKQVVEKSWVDMSIAPPEGPRGGPGGMGYEWNSTADGRQYGGNGRGGQNLIVWPDLDTIVVITAGGNPGQLAAAIRPAIKSTGSLPANPEGNAALRSKTAAVAETPPAENPSSPPPLAAKISGVRYDFPVNPSRIDSLALVFTPSGDARVEFTYIGKELSFPMGLDGRYRLGPNGPFGLIAGAMGRWTSENEFALDINFVANINHYTLYIRFVPDGVEVTANEASGLIRNGKLTGRRRS